MGPTLVVVLVYVVNSPLMYAVPVVTSVVRAINVERLISGTPLKARVYVVVEDVWYDVNCPLDIVVVWKTLTDSEERTVKPMKPVV